MQLWVAMVGMLLSGSLNTMIAKYQDFQKAPPGPGKAVVPFAAPFCQTYIMFVGEMTVLLGYAIQKWRSRRRHIRRMLSQDRYPMQRNYGLVQSTREHRPKAPWHFFALPATCDWIASTMVFVATLIISASSVQMLRGSIVVFTAFFSVIFLRRRLQPFHYVGMGFIVAGIALVALASTGGAKEERGGNALGLPQYVGVLLCLASQLAGATLYILEEKLLTRYEVRPMEAIGYEGLNGCLIGVVVLAFLTPLGVAKTSIAAYQVTHSWPLSASIIGTVLSIGAFNVYGITVTQRASAVARSTLDCSRTLLVWGGELALGWAPFRPLQLVGFALVALGTALYNKLIRVPCLQRRLSPEEIAAKGDMPGKMSPAEPLWSPNALHNARKLWPEEMQDCTVDALDAEDTQSGLDEDDAPGRSLRSLASDAHPCSADRRPFDEDAHSVPSNSGGLNAPLLRHPASLLQNDNFGG